MASKPLGKKQRAYELEGHFKWLKDFDTQKSDVGDQIDYLESELDMEPQMKMVRLAFLSFLYSQKSDYHSFEKAIEAIHKADNMDHTETDIPHFVDCRLIILANTGSTS